MKGMQFSLREKILLMVLIVFLLGYGFYQFLFLPINEERQQLVIENQELQRVLQQNTQMNQKIINGEVDLEKIKEEYALLAHKLPGRPYIPETIIFLDEAAQKDKVILTAINHKGDKNAPVVNNELQALLNTEGNSKVKLPNLGEKKNSVTANTAELRFSLKSQGSFFATTAYLLEIENAPRLYVPERLLLQAGKVSRPEEVAEEYEVRPSTLIDGYNIMMELELVTFYDTQQLEEIKDIDKEIPLAEGKENPFAR